MNRDPRTGHCAQQWTRVVSRSSPNASKEGAAYCCSFPLTGENTGAGCAPGPWAGAARAGTRGFILPHSKPGAPAPGWCSLSLLVVPLGCFLWPLATNAKGQPCPPATAQRGPRHPSPCRGRPLWVTPAPTHAPSFVPLRRQPFLSSLPTLRRCASQLPQWAPSRCPGLRSNVAPQNALFDQPFRNNLQPLYHWKIRSSGVGAVCKRKPKILEAQARPKFISF